MDPKSMFWNSPRPPGRESTPGERLVEFLRGHERFLCELRDHGEYGIEAQFYLNEEFLHGRRFDATMNPTRTPREMAIAWAEEERKAIEKGGGGAAS